MMINDLIDIKTNNAKAVLNSIRRNDAITKKDIALLTNLSFATVSNLSNELKAKGVLLDSKVDEKRVGRSPNAMTLNYERFLLVALDMQLENLLGFAIVNLRNEVLSSRTFHISSLRTAQEVVDYAKSCFDQYLLENPLGEVTFIGVGAAVPAVFDSIENVLALSSVPMFEGAPLKTMLQTAFGMPAYIDNIANISALSAYTRHQDWHDIVCMDVSQGVGAGIITHGELIRGKNGYATEIAHVPIGDPAIPCPFCGSSGCVETELSIAGMARNFPEIPEDLPLTQRWERFVKLISCKTDASERILQRIGYLSGLLATILINLFDPEILLITGYITDIYDLIYPYFYHELEIRCHTLLKRGLAVIPDNGTPRDQNVYIGIGDVIYDHWTPLL